MSEIEELYNREVYPGKMALEIEVMGTVPVSIANRWLLGWPNRVKTLLGKGVYLDRLKAQAEIETSILVEETGMRHLSRMEILRVHEINEAPPIE